MAARQQQHSIIRTTTLYPEAVIPQGSARRTPWGPLLVGLLIVVTAGLALAWSLGLTGPREADPEISDTATPVRAAPPRSPYPTDMTDLGRDSVRASLPPTPRVAESAPITEPPPPPIADAALTPPPTPMLKPQMTPRVERIRAPPPPPTTKPRVAPLAKDVSNVLAAPRRPAIRATATPREVFSPRAAQPLSGPLAGLFAPSDYPAAARRNGERGDVTVRLAIGNDGRVSACRILAADASAALKSATCAILIQRARFAAATDAHGDATVGAFVQHVAWRLP